MWTSPEARPVTAEQRRRQEDSDEQMARSLVEEEAREAGYPTKREAENLAAKQGRTDAQRNRKVTGEEAPFATLNMQRSWDPVMNQIYTIHGRMITHKWKQFLLQLRYKESREHFKQEWRRPLRWLALVHATETAALWGHLGVAARELRGVKGAGMYK